MNYKQFIEDLKLKILLAILLLLGACNKPIDLSEIEIGSKAENYNLDSNLFTKKECLDYLYKIDNDSIILISSQIWLYPSFDSESLLHEKGM